jgi:hypothetical protein
MFGKRKKLVEKIESSITLIEKNSVLIAKIKVLYEAFPVLVEKISTVEADLKFLSPRDDKATVDKDKKIGALLDDLELGARRTIKTGDVTEAEEIIKKIKLVLSER